MTPEQAAKLRAPFPPEQIGKLPKPTKRDNPRGHCDFCGGYHGLPAVHLDYVGHAAVTDRLLQVDPEWTWEPAAVGPNGEPLIVNEGLWIRLTVAGVTRWGFGDSTMGKGQKEMIGDAIRNAAMRFGVGLDLWAKENLGGDDHQPDRPEPDADDPDGPRTQKQNKRLHAVLGRLDSQQPRPEGPWKEYAREWTEVQFDVRSSADLTVRQCDDLIAHLEAVEVPFG